MNNLKNRYRKWVALLAALLPLVFVGTVQALIEARLVDLDRPVEQLHRVRDVLRHSLRVCRRGRRRSVSCGVVEDLRSEASGRPSQSRRRRASR